MGDERLRRELDQLRARLARVEAALGVTQQAEPPPEVPAVPPVTPVVPAFSPVAREEPQEPPAPLEVLIGTKWAAWGGAIVVVLAVGFFVKLAVDEGWWGGLSELTRCLLAAGLGFALLAAGETALRNESVQKG